MGYWPWGGGGGGGGIPRTIGWGVRLTSQNPFPIYDQNQQFSQAYLKDLTR